MNVVITFRVVAGMTWRKGSFHEMENSIVTDQSGWDLWRARAKFWFDSALARCRC